MFLHFWGQEGDLGPAVGPHANFMSQVSSDSLPRHCVTLGSQSIGQFSGGLSPLAHTLRNDHFWHWTQGPGATRAGFVLKALTCLVLSTPTIQSSSPNAKVSGNPFLRRPGLQHRHCPNSGGQISRHGFSSTARFSEIVRMKRTGKRDRSN